MSKTPLPEDRNEGMTGWADSKEGDHWTRPRPVRIKEKVPLWVRVMEVLAGAALGYLIAQVVT